jgi:hypothetical protein
VSDTSRPRIELRVFTEDPTKSSVPTLFSNYVAISRAGTEVQFEFVALDINVLAAKMQAQAAEAPGPVEVTGKTMAKIVLPLHAFMQLEQHLQTIFSAVKQEFAFEKVEPNERRAIS